MKRTQLVIRLSDDERADLAFVAGPLPWAETVRRMIRRYAAALRQSWAEYEAEQAEAYRRTK